MIIHLTPADFESVRSITAAFRIIKMFQPLIVVIEDADACGLEEKSKVTGAYLDCIDEVNKDLNMVIIQTVNDTSMVHYTLLDRPGRSDAVVEISPPRDIQEAFQVVENRLSSSMKDYADDFEISIEDNTPVLDVLKHCVNKKFTQADIANALVERALIDIGLEKGSDEKPVLNSMEFSIYLKKAYDKHLETKKAIKDYKLNNDSQAPEDGPDLTTKEEAAYAGTKDVLLN